MADVCRLSYRWAEHERRKVQGKLFPIHESQLGSMELMSSIFQAIIRTTTGQLKRFLASLFESLTYSIHSQTIIWIFSLAKMKFSFQNEAIIPSLSIKLAIRIGKRPGSIHSATLAPFLSIILQLKHGFANTLYVAVCFYTPQKYYLEHYFYKKFRYNFSLKIHG